MDPGGLWFALLSSDGVAGRGCSRSAALIWEILSGKDGPATQIVLANAAAALLAAEQVTTPVQGVA